MDEARLERTEYGTSAATEGWFAVNLRDAAWVTNDDFGAACIFEGDAAPFAQIGYTVAVLQPGQPNGMYHREDDQEDFLVLSGECLLIVEGEERSLRAWDFVHCPAGTEHIFVGAGDGPCVIFMAGRPRAQRHRGVSTRRGRAAPRRRGGDEDRLVKGGVRAVCEVAARAADAFRRAAVRLTAAAADAAFKANRDGGEAVAANGNGLRLGSREGLPIARYEEVVAWAQTNRETSVGACMHARDDSSLRLAADRDPGCVGSHARLARPLHRAGGPIQD